MHNDKLGFFDYFELTKEAFRKLSAQYPEVGELSFRELEVFSQLLSDKTQEQIGKELFITSSAVHFHCKNIYKKLGVTSRRQILIKYKDL